MLERTSLIHRKEGEVERERREWKVEMNERVNKSECKGNE
jgi:hypothetical protein